jgi:hypothetical protein
MVIVAERMRHPSTPLHGHCVATIAQQLAIVLSFVPFEIELRCDDVRRGEILE